MGLQLLGPIKGSCWTRSFQSLPGKRVCHREPVLRRGCVAHEKAATKGKRVNTFVNKYFVNILLTGRGRGVQAHLEQVPGPWRSRHAGQRRLKVAQSKPFKLFTCKPFVYIPDCLHF